MQCNMDTATVVYACLRRDVCPCAVHVVCRQQKEWCTNAGAFMLLGFLHHSSGTAGAGSVPSS